MELCKIMMNEWQFLINLKGAHFAFCIWLYIQNLNKTYVFMLDKGPRRTHKDS